MQSSDSRREKNTGGGRVGQNETQGYRHIGGCVLGHTHKHVLLDSPRNARGARTGLGYKNEGREGLISRARGGERCCNHGAARRAAEGTEGRGGGSTIKGWGCRGQRGIYLGLCNQPHRRICGKGNGRGECVNHQHTKSQQVHDALKRPGRGWGRGLRLRGGGCQPALGWGGHGSPPLRKPTQNTGVGSVL